MMSPPRRHCAVLGLALLSTPAVAGPLDDTKDLSHKSASSAYQQLQEERRRALVIGESNYRHAPRLPGVESDARLLSETLRDAGFEVTRLLDEDKLSVERSLASFVEQTQPGDVLLVYWSGHGVQREGTNWLIPVDADLQTPGRLTSDAINADNLVSQLGRTPARLRVLVLDACRNNPWEKSWVASGKALGETGLATPPSTPTGFVIAYATAPGRTAADGGSRAGPYARALAESLARPMELQELFQEVHGQVERETKGNQLPWVSMALGPGRFFFTLPREEEYRLRYENLRYGELDLTLRQPGMVLMDGEPLGRFPADSSLTQRLAEGQHRVCLEDDCRVLLVEPDRTTTLVFEAQTRNLRAGRAWLAGGGASLAISGGMLVWGLLETRSAVACGGGDVETCVSRHTAEAASHADADWSSMSEAQQRSQVLHYGFEAAAERRQVALSLASGSLVVGSVLLSVGFAW